MKKRFTHKVCLHKFIKTHEEEYSVICSDIMSLINDDINLYGIVDDFKIYYKDKQCEFYVTLYDHHGVNAESYIRDLIDKEKERYYNEKNN